MRKIKKIVMSVLLVVGMVAGTPMASMAAMNTSAYQSGAVHMMDNAWKLNMNNVNAETRALMQELANGATVVVTPKAEKNYSYSFPAYCDFIRMMREAGHYDIIDAEIDYQLGDRSALDPKEGFKVALGFHSLNLKNEIEGSAEISSAVQTVLLNAQVTEGMDQKEAVHRIANAVADYLAYDGSYRTEGALDGIRNRRGVCRHYSILFEYACENCGIDCARIVSADKTHEWNVTCIGGENQYTDVTYYDALRDSSYILMSRQDIIRKGGYTIAPNVVWGAGI